MNYRHLPVVKIVKGKTKRYRNLASFHAECPKRSLKGNFCTLRNIRKLKAGGGLATVDSQYPGGDENIFHRGARPSGVWRLHFESYVLLKQDLKGRVVVPTSKAGALDGTRRRR